MEHWTLPERQLSIELSIGIARRLTTILSPSSSEFSERIGPGYLWHMHTSDFTRGCDILWKLEVAYAAYGQESYRKDFTVKNVKYEKTWPPYFRFLNTEEIREKLNKGFPAAAPLPGKVIEAYISIVCNYGARDALLSTSREPFYSQKEYVREISALEKTDYLKTTGSQVIWTKKIAPFMQQSGLWERDGRPSDAVRRELVSKKCDALLKNTPEMTVRILQRKAQNSSELDFVVLLREQFDGLYIRKYPDGTERTGLSDPVEILVVKEIYRKLRSY